MRDKRNQSTYFAHMRPWPSPSSHHAGGEKATERSEGVGMRSPLLHARASWQDLVKRRSLSKNKRFTESYDLENIHHSADTVETRSVSKRLWPFLFLEQQHQEGEKRLECAI